MAKFNTKFPVADPVANMINRPDATSNHEGDLAFKLDPRMALYQIACTTMVNEPKFYLPDKGFKNVVAISNSVGHVDVSATPDDMLLAAIHKCLAEDPKFVLQLATYCRYEQHLRSVPLVMAVEFANAGITDKVPGATDYIAGIIGRADEITEMVAYQFQRNAVAPRKTLLPMVIKRALKNVFESGKFDEYQYAKYNREGPVKLCDVVALTHPSGKGTPQEELITKICNGSLKTPDTWEVARSTQKENWHQVLHSKFVKGDKVNNYMAILKNLVNMLNSEEFTRNDCEILAKALSNPYAVRRSQLFPFRFMVASKMVNDKVNRPEKHLIMLALEDAINLSISNIPKMPGNTLVCGDVSGSMDGGPSVHGMIRHKEIAALLTIMAAGFSAKAYCALFANHAALIEFKRHGGIIDTAKKAMVDHRINLGGGTHPVSVFEMVIPYLPALDRIIFVTDEEFWSSGSRNGFGVSGLAEFHRAFMNYRQSHPAVKLYLYNVNSYGTSVMPHNYPGVFNVAGWSDATFKVMAALENGYEIINEIGKIQPRFNGRKEIVEASN